MKTGQGFVLGYSITTNTSFEAASKLRNQILRIKEDSQDVRLIFLFFYNFLEYYYIQKKNYNIR